MRQEVLKKDRYALMWLVLFVYFVPVVTLSFLSASALSFSHSRNLFSSGILFAVTGSLLIFFILIKSKERRLITLKKPVSDEIVKEVPLSDLEERLSDVLDREAQLLSDIEELKYKWHQKKQEIDLIKSEVEETEESNTKSLNAVQEQIKKKDLMIAQYAQTINDLRTTMEHKQQTIDKLESSVSDLSYDLSTLLKLSQYDTPEEEKPAPVKPQPVQIPKVKQTSEQEGIRLLEKCINIAQKMVSTYFESNSSRFQNVQFDSTALDTRRLYDSFSSETNSVVMVYSLKERRALFANEQVKSITGWGSETFARDFMNLVRQGQEEWREALVELPQTQKGRFHLILRHKDNEDVMMQGFIGLIPTGIFKNHAVVVLIPIT